MVPKEIDGALLNQNAVRLELGNDNELTKPYFFYALRSGVFRNYLNMHSHGTANQDSLKLEDILMYTVCIPPKPEQNLITEYLDKKISVIDKISEKQKGTLVCLKEYRTTLISEVVTGKIDVREEVINNGTTRATH
jgi:type I restriction enzyme S subunit